MSRAAGIKRVPWRLRYEYGSRAGSKLRKIAILATHRHCTVRFEGPVLLGPGFTLHIPERGTLIVGSGVGFRRGVVIEINGTGRVTIGAGCIFTSSALIQCSTSIDIGERCAIGQSVLIADGYHRYGDPDRHWLDQGYDFRPIVIGDGAGISDKCTVQASVGERTMVASHSTVNRDLPSWVVAAGSPARPVRRIKD